MVKRSVLSFAFLLLLAVPAAFPQVEEQVNVGIIEIWAKATDGNNHVVTDLQPQDFSILIDGKKADLRCFDRTFDVGKTTSDGEPTGSINGLADRQKRTFIFFFDLLHSSPRDIDYLKSRVVGFLQNSFKDEDQGIIFALLPSVNLGVVQKMTTSKEALMSVVKKMAGNSSLEKRVRGNEKELMDVLYAFTAPNTTGAGDRGGPGSRAPETILYARNLARTYAAQERNLSKISLNSFVTIAEYLAATSYDGRPVMIYVSGGFSLRPGQNYYQMVEHAIEQQFVRGTEDLGYWEYPPDNDFQNEVRKTIGVLNRLNITIYSVDANGLEGFDRSSDRSSTEINLGGDRVAYNQELQDSLAMVSEETGGLAFLNSQNFDLSLGEIASDMGQQYWLCANLPGGSKRGTFHKIEVKVARSDVDVRYRKSYVD